MIKKKRKSISSFGSWYSGFDRFENKQKDNKLPTALKHTKNILHQNAKKMYTCPHCKKDQVGVIKYQEIYTYISFEIDIEEDVKEENTEYKNKVNWKCPNCGRTLDTDLSYKVEKLTSLLDDIKYIFLNWNK